MLSEGFLWFTDLSSPDPTGILPLAGGIISLLNILSTSTMNTSVVMRKFRRFVYIFPFISVPIWMTFPSAFNLYWITTSSIQLICVNLFRFEWFRNFCGIPEYIPGSKLERLNSKKVLQEESLDHNGQKTVVLANAPKKKNQKKR